MSYLRYQYPTLSTWPTFNRLLDLATREIAAPAGWTPALDLYENEDAYVATIELPGLKAEDLSIDLRDGVLTLSGERKAEANGGAFRNERPAGKFSRKVELPHRVDAQNVKAEYKDGVLTVTLPKAEDAKPRKINVSLN
jgi:HSP20 family protein